MAEPLGERPSYELRIFCFFASNSSCEMMPLSRRSESFERDSILVPVAALLLVTGFLSGFGVVLNAYKTAPTGYKNKGKYIGITRGIYLCWYLNNIQIIILINHNVAETKARVLDFLSGSDKASRRHEQA